MSKLNSIQDIKYCLYINLENREDRKELVEKECKKIGVNSIRFNAVKMINGRIGCSLSHLKCLQIAKKNNWPYVMVCEDDLLFLNKEKAKSHMNDFLKRHSSPYDICNVITCAQNFTISMMPGKCDNASSASGGQTGAKLTMYGVLVTEIGFNANAGDVKFLEDVNWRFTDLDVETINR